MKIRIAILGSTGSIGKSTLSIIKNNKSKFTVENAVQDLKKAFQENLLPNSLNDEKYFNIKRMRSIKLT